MAGQTQGLMNPHLIAAAVQTDGHSVHAVQLLRHQIRQRRDQDDLNFNTLAAGFAAVEEARLLRLPSDGEGSVDQKQGFPHLQFVIHAVLPKKAVCFPCAHRKTDSLALLV